MIRMQQWDGWSCSRNRMSLNTSHEFVGFKLNGGGILTSMHFMGKSFGWNDLIAVLRSFCNVLQKRKRRDPHQKLYVETYKGMTSLSIEHLIGSVNMLVEYRTEDELRIRLNGKVTKALSLPSNNENHLKIQSERFAKYVSRALGEVHDCFSWEIGKQHKVETLGILITELPAYPWWELKWMETQNRRRMEAKSTRLWSKTKSVQ